MGSEMCIRDRDWATLDTSVAESSKRPVAERLRLFTARAGVSLFEVDFRSDDILVFGCESTGLPEVLLTRHSDRRVRVPTRDSVRSLNLANIVCLGAYVALHHTGDLDSIENP